MAVFLETYRRLLGRFGQDVTVRRYAGIGAARAIAASVVLRAHVARYDAAELGGRIVQGDRKVVLMTADLGALAPLSTFTDVVTTGMVIKKMISNTNITSTRGVVLIVPMISSSASDPTFMAMMVTPVITYRWCRAAQSASQNRKRSHLP